MRSVVRQSCTAFVHGEECVARVHPEQIDLFLDSIDRSFYETVLKKEKAQMTMPLRFETEHQKLNFFCIMHLLNFGSGYRVILKAANGSGAFDNIIKLLIAAHLTHGTLDRSWMQSVTVEEIGQLMNLELMVEVPVPDNPILHELKPSPASVLVKTIAEALHDTGKRLERFDCLDLLDFVELGIKQSSDIDALLSHLARLSVLEDIFTTTNGTRVYIYKKAQVMLSELGRNGLSIPCMGPDDLTIFSDNCLPTMLRHFKLLSCPAAEEALQRDLELEPIQAASLRAASVVICEAVVARARERKIEWIGNEVDLDNYLWKVAKEGDLRKLPRYVERNTWYY